MGKKLGSNRCPLFTMLTKQKIINILHSKLVKKKKKKMILLSWVTYPFWRKLVSFHGWPTHTPTGLFSQATCLHIHIGLFSGATDPHTHTVYFHGRLALKLTVVYFHGRPEHTWLSWSIFTGDLNTHDHPGLFSGATDPHTHTSLFSWATCPHMFIVVYFQGRPAHTLTLVYFQGRPAHTCSSWSIFKGDRPIHSY